MRGRARIDASKDEADPDRKEQTSPETTAVAAAAQNKASSAIPPQPIAVPAWTAARLSATDETKPTQIPMEAQRASTK